MAEAIDKMFGKGGRRKRFGDEGPPVSDMPRGPAADMGPEDSSAPDMDDDADDAPGGDAMPGADPEAQAADDLADVLGVPDADMGDFQDALSRYVQACVDKKMGGGGAPPLPGGSPGGGY